MNKLTVEDLKITLQMRLAEVDRRIQLGRQERLRASNKQAALPPNKQQPRRQKIKIKPQHSVTPISTATVVAAVLAAARVLLRTVGRNSLGSCSTQAVM